MLTPRAISAAPLVGLLLVCSACGPSAVFAPYPLPQGRGSRTLTPARGSADPSLKGEGVRAATDSDIAQLVRRLEAGEPGEPITLEACTRIALANNYDLISAGHHDAIARLALRGAQAALYPRLQHQTSLQHLEPGPPDLSAAFGIAPGFSFTVQNKADVSVTLAYTLWDFGQRRYQVAAGQESVQAAYLQQMLARQSVRYLTAEAWFGVHQAQSQLEVINASIPALEKALHDQRSRETLGRGVRADTLLVEVTLNRRRQELVKAGDAVRQAVWRLNQVMGVKIDAPTQAAPAPAAPSPSPQATAILPAAACVATALKKHPALQRNLSEQRALALQRQASAARSWPELDVAAAYKYTTDDQFENPNSLVLGATLNWLLFDGGARRAQEQSLERQEALKSTAYDQLAARVEQQVRAARMRLDQIQGDRVIAQQAVEQAQLELQREQERRAQGLSTQRDVLDAQARLTARQSERVRLAYSYHVAVAALALAMGADSERLRIQVPAEKP